jgi:hypothetical protein
MHLVSTTLFAKQDSNLKQSQSTKRVTTHSTALLNNRTRGTPTLQLQFQFSAPQLEVHLHSANSVAAGVAPVSSRAAMPPSFSNLNHNNTTSNAKAMIGRGVELRSSQS